MRQSNAVRAVVSGGAFALAFALACGSPRGSGADQHPLGSALAPAPSGAAEGHPAAPGSALASPGTAASSSPESSEDGPVPAASVAVPSSRPRIAFGGPPPPSAPEGRLFVDCYAGFVPQATPRVDVQRLALACGPSTGLTPFARTTGTVDEAGSPAVFRWEAKRGDCFRLFAVASAPVDDLEVEIAESPDDHGSLTNQNRRWVVVADDRPFCSPRAGTFVARFTTHGGRGAFAAAVFRGERMLPKR